MNVTGISIYLLYVELFLCATHYIVSTTRDGCQCAMKTVQHFPTNFSEIYAELSNSNFVVRHTNGSGSVVPIDQALEQVYNNPAIIQAGIIGYTRIKDALCNLNMKTIKYSRLLQMVCFIDENEGYSFHHEFSTSLPEDDEKFVSVVVEYIWKQGNPFDFTRCKELVNINTKTD